MKYPLRTDKDIDFVNRTVDILQSRMDEISKKSNVLDTQKLAVMAALSITAELVEGRDEQEETGRILEEIIKKIDR
jgi:cell division protein ZapA (FtsZ GTPase activity inhibitor)